MKDCSGVIVALIAITMHEFRFSALLTNSSSGNDRNTCPRSARLSICSRSSSIRRSEIGSCMGLRDEGSEA